jgi:hypothetical protein
LFALSQVQPGKLAAVGEFGTILTSQVEFENGNAGIRAVQTERGSGFRAARLGASPFIQFGFTSARTGDASITAFSADGKRLGVVFRGKAVAGVPQKKGGYLGAGRGTVLLRLKVTDDRGGAWEAAAKVSVP